MFEIGAWADPGGVPGTVRALVAGGRFGSDLPETGEHDCAAEIATLRSQLGSEELDRFRVLCSNSAAAIDEAARGLAPGQTELEVAGRLSDALVRRGAVPIVLQVAFDERVSEYRHLLPTERRLERYAFLSFCARQWGLVASLTRLVHLGAVPAELRQRAAGVARVDATMLHATRAGAVLGDVFDQARAAYAAVGHSGAWREHHQGGLAGYETRELVVRPGCKVRVAEGQVVAWNPSLAGVKSEDTALVRAGEPCEVLTTTPRWPALRVEVDGHALSRPGILELT